MSLEQEADKILKKKIKRLIPMQALVAKVLNVDENQYTCDVMPLSSTAELFKVRLKPTIDNVKKGVIAIPVVGSFIVVGLLNNNENSAFVISCSNITKYYIIGDNGNYIELKDDGTLLINGDSFGGLVKVQELTNKINALENLVNNILVTLKNTTIPLAPSGTYPFSPLYTALSNITPITQQSDIENTKVKHG